MIEQPMGIETTETSVQKRRWSQQDDVLTARVHVENQSLGGDVRSNSFCKVEDP